MTKGDEVRYVIQFHYSGWPDHGIPEDPAHIRDMIGFMREARQNSIAPLVVHCRYITKNVYFMWACRKVINLTEIPNSEHNFVTVAEKSIIL